VFVYGVIAYAVFFVTYLYAVGFVGNVLVPKSLDSTPVAPFWTALLINAALLALFAVQHSVMARTWFKRALLNVIPQAAERSTYVLASSLALILLFWQWSPLGGVIWDVQNPIGRTVLFALFLFGFLLVLYTTFLINHFDLFGLRQVWLYLLGREYRPLSFVTPGPYRLVRHPLYLGWFFAFWATPTMTATHLFFAVMTTAYILLAIQFEERDLIAAHPEYADYRRRVPMIIPSGTRTAPAGKTARVGAHLAVLFALCLSPGYVFAQNHAHGGSSDRRNLNALVHVVREATARFKDVQDAENEEFHLLFGCVSGGETGAMGLHYVNMERVMDGELDPSRPEIILYEPLPTGRLRLTGADFLVFADAWDAANPGNPPQLMGQLFHRFEAPNRFGLPAFYTLHVWAWKDNPSGTFVNWHDNVSCDGFNDAQ
jgi:protein-S-isoprenylcysteine O-methyltransferase Ste14